MLQPVFEQVNGQTKGVKWQAEHTITTSTDVGDSALFGLGVQKHGWELFGLLVKTQLETPPLPPFAGF